MSSLSIFNAIGEFASLVLFPLREDRIDAPLSLDSVPITSTELPDTVLFRRDVDTIPLMRLDGSSRVSKTLADVFGVR